MTSPSLPPPAVAERLREARRASGMSQEAVAAELGVSRPTLIAVEQGRRPPRPEELVQLAGLYGRTVHELVRTSAPNVGLSAQFRLGGRTATSDNGEAVDVLQRLADDVVELETLLAAPASKRYPEPYDIDGLPLDLAAQQVAEAERLRLGLGDGPVLRLREVLETEIGLRVFFVSLPSNVAGLFAHAEPAGSCIAVNTKHPHERQRWTMAHEYGHFLTSRWSAEVTSTAPGRASVKERFADAFAAHLLMPGAGLARRFQSLRKSRGSFTATDLLQLAASYEVSSEALVARLEDLRLIASGWWQDLLGRGLRVNRARAAVGIAPAVGDVQVMPRRIQYLAVEAFLDGVLSEGQLATLLRLDRTAARRLVRRLSASEEVDAEGDTHDYAWDLTVSDDSAIA